MSGTSYYTIYKKAVTEFKDPTLNKLLEQQSVLFFEVMYNFLENAIPLFTNPTVQRKKIRNNIPPQNFINEFTGDGITNQYIIQNHPQSKDMDNTIIEITINDTPVQAKYDETNNTVLFDNIPQEGSNIKVQLYYVGEFAETLNYDEEYILSQFIVACWSEYITNDKLDIIRLLGDTDFKLTQNSTTTQAKTQWNIVNKETVIKRMNKYAWDTLMLK